jgi:hypothetical protein
VNADILTSLIELILFSYAWYVMADLTPLNTQIDTTLTVMADAVSELQASVKALAVAQTGGDDAAIAASVERLKQGTDSLAAAIAAARAKRA